MAECQSAEHLVTLSMVSPVLSSSSTPTASSSSADSLLSDNGEKLRHSVRDQASREKQMAHHSSDMVQSWGRSLLVQEGP